MSSEINRVVEEKLKEKSNYRKKELGLNCFEIADKQIEFYKNCVDHYKAKVGEILSEDNCSKKALCKIEDLTHLSKENLVKISNQVQDEIYRRLAFELNIYILQHSADEHTNSIQMKMRYIRKKLESLEKRLEIMTIKLSPEQVYVKYFNNY